MSQPPEKAVGSRWSRLIARWRSLLDHLAPGPSYGPLPWTVAASVVLPGGQLPAVSTDRSLALAQIGLAAQQAANEGIWWRLKICSYDDCRWAYYDHSKNRSRSW